MNIDRNRFLFLVTTISTSAAVVLAAASGCTINTTSTNADAASPIDTGVAPTDPDSGVLPVEPDSGNGGACLADKNTGPACPLLDGSAPKCAADCTRYSGLFKSDVAENIRECMDVAPTCEGGVACAQAAVAQACDDPTATTFCTAALACQTAPGGIDGGFDGGSGSSDPMTACTNTVRALTAAGRTDLQNCLDDYGGACATATLADCINGIYAQN